MHTDSLPSLDSPLTDPNLRSTTVGTKGRTGGYWRRSVLTMARGLDWLWRAFAYVVGGLIFGGLLLNIVISYLTTGTPGITDPRTWVVVQYVLSDIQDSALIFGAVAFIAMIAYLGHRFIRNADIPDLPADVLAQYTLMKVKRVNPSETYIHAFRPSVYIPRKQKFTGEDADNPHSAVSAGSLWHFPLVP
jgi:hypothetical protein